MEQLRCNWLTLAKVLEELRLRGVLGAESHFASFLRDLHRLFCSGLVHARGHRWSGRDSVEQIPTTEWLALSLDSDGYRFCSSRLFSAEDSRAVWTDIEVCLDDLLAHWPKASEADVGATWDPEAHMEAMVQRTRANRLRHEAADQAWRKALTTERDRPIEERSYFAIAEVSKGLACDPRNLVIDPGLRARIEKDIFEGVEGRHFTAAEVATLTGDPPEFRHFQVSHGQYLVPDPEALFLSRDGCQRYLQAQVEMPGRAKLLRDWFGKRKPTPSSQQPPPAPPKTRIGAVKNWWAVNHASMVGRNVPEIRREFCRAIKIDVSDSTIRRALGLK